MTKLKQIRSYLRVGKVYRREQLQIYSTSIDRELIELVKNGTLKKLETGLYYVPRKTVFGEAPPERNELVKAFLKDTNFLITSSNNYNSLGVGTTQLYNNTIVYNYKRHGRFNLAGQVFDFRRVNKIPHLISKEFLLVDLVNNLKDLAEDISNIKENIKNKLAEFDKKKLRNIVNYFGKISTKKFFEALLK